MPSIRKLMDHIWELTAKLPSTNARIGLSLILILGTGVRVIATWEAPPWDWMGFLLVLSGLDVAQFTAKRRSHTDFVKAKNGENGPAS